MGYVTAGAVVLLGLGCLATELADLVEQCTGVSVDGEAPSVEQEISTTSNVLVDLAAIYVIIERARAYLKLSQEIASLRSYNQGERAELQKQLNKWILSSPIYAALAFVEFFKILAGFLSPYAGESLQRSAAQLGELHDLLDLAVPSSRWAGVAAEGYGDEVALLQSLVAKLAGRDKDLAASAQHQADLVTHTRLALGIVEGLLIVAMEVEASYYYAELPEKAVEFARLAASLGMAAVYAILLALPAMASGKSIRSAKSAFRAYSDAAHTPVTGSALANLLRAGVAASPSTGTTDFEAFATGLPALSQSAVSVEAVAPVERFVGLSAEAYRQLPRAGRPPGPPQRSVSRVLPSRRPDRQTAGQAAPAQVGPVGSDVDGAGAPAVSERVPVEVAVRGPELAGSAWQT